ncbi:hypothetical protein SAMN04490243_2840 [Robiginitalea myxolifaciens]|uniref:Uncharacterized protein n=1 Tax=Robiginitalea myxolifaciens TaxID=400055 RepID=A0A1I6HK99_9FLAO|nr:hypothetical protein [Robiginitalea myxolifaciens]SFR54865.1 hypothetical protein SAMN04490243_2840 [Robiginitalea myxolifaciens]
MRIYDSLEEIEQDLRVYDLQRQIAVEEAKAAGLTFQQRFIPNNLTSMVLKLARRWGMVWLMRKIAS